MKLAEALALRSDAQKRLAQLEARAVTAEIEGLIVRINRTNAASDIDPGFTITDAIARRDVLALRRKVVVAVADAAAGTSDNGGSWGRQLRSELREITAVAVGELRQEADDLAKQHREIDLRIQAANWATELMD